MKPSAFTPDKIWESGYSLNDALGNLVSEKTVRAKYNKAPKSNSGNNEITKSKLKQAGFNADQLIDSIGTAMDSWSKQVQRSAIRQELLLKALIHEKLVAVGIPIHDPKARIPESIPKFLFKSQYINWLKSEISGYGHVYAEVRIVKARDFEKSITRTEKIKTGRPAFKDDVFKIIEELNHKGILNASQSKKAIAAQILERGMAKFPERFLTTMPSIQTIIRHYNSYLNAK